MTTGRGADDIGRAGVRRAGASGRELGLAGAVTALVIVVQVLAVDGLPLLSRHLWLDEVHTELIAADPSPMHALRALAAGTDTNPPAVFVLIRAFSLPFGDVTPVSMRAFALTSMILALLGTYAVLRTALRWPAAAVGVAVLWTSPLITRHAFEARFYGPLLAATAWYVYALIRTRDAPPRRWPGVLLAVTSALVCTLHYFGIIALLVTLPVELALGPGTRRERLRRLAPAMAGPVALGLCLPLLLAQRRALPGPTWVPPVDAASVVEYVRDLLPGAPSLLAALGGIVAGAAVWLLLARPSRDAVRALAPALALAAVPFVVLAFSLVAQPALMGRYAIASQVALAAVVALLVSRLPRVWAIGLAGLLLVLSTLLVHRHAQRWSGPRGYHANLEQLIADLRTTPGDVPILYDLRQFHYPVARVAPDLAARSAFLGLEPGSPRQTPGFIDYERRIARQIEQFYPRYRTIDEARAAELTRFVFVSNAPPGHIEQRFGATVQPLARSVYDVRRHAPVRPPVAED